MRARSAGNGAVRMYILTRRVLWALLVVLFFGVSLVSALAIPSLARLGDTPLALEGNLPYRQITLSGPAGPISIEDNRRNTSGPQGWNSLADDAYLHYGQRP